MTTKLIQELVDLSKAAKENKEYQNLMEFIREFNSRDGSYIQVGLLDDGKMHIKVFHNNGGSFALKPICRPDSDLFSSMVSNAIEVLKSYEN